MDQVAQICNLTLNLEKGKMVYWGEVDGGLEQYFEANKGQGAEADSFKNIFVPVKSVRFQLSKTHIKYGETIELASTIETPQVMQDNLFRVVLYDERGLVASEWNNKRIGKKIDLKEGSNIIRIKLGPIYLKNGEYKFGIVLNDSTGIREVVRSFKQYTLYVSGTFKGSTSYQLPGHESDEIQNI
jgi:hypothetical protein